MKLIVPLNLCASTSTKVVPTIVDFVEINKIDFPFLWLFNPLLTTERLAVFDYLGVQND